MTRLDPDALSVTTFDTAPLAVSTTVDSDNCVSPLCMTEGRECTTPWCPKEPADTVAG